MSTVIEVLFPEFCNMFGDSSNMKYLKHCLPDAEFKYTAYTDEPYFAKDKPALIYLGAMTEKKQELVIKKLLPLKERLADLIKQGVPMLFTNNALEVLGSHIETDEGNIECLGLYPFKAKRFMMNRINSLVRGQFKGMEIVGFKTQFTKAYDCEKGKNVHQSMFETEFPFIRVDKGLGMNEDIDREGFRDNNLFATYLVGPFLILNPDFTLYLMREVMKLKDAKLAFEPEIREAYKRRVEEFHNPKTEY